MRCDTADTDLDLGSRITAKPQRKKGCCDGTKKKGYKAGRWMMIPLMMEYVRGVVRDPVCLRLRVRACRLSIVFVGSYLRNPGAHTCYRVSRSCPGKLVASTIRACFTRVEVDARHNVQGSLSRDVIP